MTFNYASLDITKISTTYLVQVNTTVQTDDSAAYQYSKAMSKLLHILFARGVSILTATVLGKQYEFESCQHSLLILLISAPPLLPQTGHSNT